jgi:hypothetical protein
VDDLVAETVLQVPTMPWSLLPVGLGSSRGGGEGEGRKEVDDG